MSPALKLLFITIVHVCADFAAVMQISAGMV